MNAGEYPQPLPRKVTVQCPVISGYVTARLRGQEIVPITLSGGTLATRAFATLENTGNTQFSVLLRETDDHSVSGTRYTVMSAVPLVAGGRVMQGVTTGTREFMEVYCSAGSGVLRMQLESERRWQQMGFNKDDPYYPPQAFQATWYPGPTT